MQCSSRCQIHHASSFPPHLPTPNLQPNLPPRSTRFHKSFKFYSSGGGPNGPSGGGKSGGGGGGGDGGKGDGKGDEGEDGKKKTGFWKGWEDRVAFDPEFPFKVFLEQVRGETALLGSMCLCGDVVATLAGLRVLGGWLGVPRSHRRHLRAAH